MLLFSSEFLDIKPLQFWINVRCKDRITPFVVPCPNRPEILRVTLDESPAQTLASKIVDLEITIGEQRMLINELKRKLKMNR